MPYIIDFQSVGCLGVLNMELIYRDDASFHGITTGEDLCLLSCYSGIMVWETS